jgi:hypothetical protein
MQSTPPPDVAAHVAAWAEGTLAALGFLTLVGALWIWRERWRIANLRVGRRAYRAYRARRVMRLWLAYREFAELVNPAALDQDAEMLIRAGYASWRGVVTDSEDEVQAILEEMVDLAGEAGPLVRRATRPAYLRFMMGSDRINEPPPSGDLPRWRAQLVAAREHFTAAYRSLGHAGPRALLSPTAIKSECIGFVSGRRIGG